MKVKDLLKVVNCYSPKLVIIEAGTFTVAYEKDYSSEPNLGYFYDMDILSIDEITLTHIVIIVKEFLPFN